ncbi:MAG TPA: patatin-like phospholipase family protein [Acidimicrobiales bacterium]|nr:patatin-like phospholipase family protein [Acidimicrobiales bacterium]
MSQPPVTTAIALSGGANLGPMHAGAVVALLEAGLQPDLLVGTSVGAMNAAYLATRPGLASARELGEAWANLRRRDAFRFSLGGAIAGFLAARDHLVSPSRLAALMRQWVTVERIEDAPVRFAAVATDALSGEPVVLDRGPVVPALMASSAIPGLLPAVRHLGRWLIDGTLSASCPALQAQDLGADVVYVVTTRTAPRVRPPRGALAMAMNSVSLLTARAAAEQLATARRRAEASGGTVLEVPTGEPPAPGPFDFNQARFLFARSYAEASSWCRDNLGSRATQ